MIISIDIETYSSVDLSLTGVTKYAAAPDFDILLMAWAEGNGPVDATFFEDVQGPYAATIFHSWLILVRGTIRRDLPVTSATASLPKC